MCKFETDGDDTFEKVIEATLGLNRNGVVFLMWEGGSTVIDNSQNYFRGILHKSVDEYDAGLSGY